MKLRKLLEVMAVGVFAAASCWAQPRSLVVTLPTDANITNEVSTTLGSDDVRGYIDQVDFYCATNATGTWSMALIPKDTSFPTVTLVTTNATSNSVTVWPRVGTADRYAVIKESVKFAVTNVSDSNLTWKARIKWSD